MPLLFVRHEKYPKRSRVITDFLDHDSTISCRRSDQHPPVDLQVCQEACVCQETLKEFLAHYFLQFLYHFKHELKGVAVVFVLFDCGKDMVSRMAS